MDIILSNSSDQPIYEQIAAQMERAILNGELAEGERLPSIRSLANGLQVSVITTKRAYTELERRGFIDTVQGKGSFVSGGSAELLQEGRLRRVEALLAQAVDEARATGVDLADLPAMLDLIIQDARECTSSGRKES